MQEENSTISEELRDNLTAKLALSKDRNEMIQLAKELGMTEEEAIEVADELMAL